MTAPDPRLGEIEAIEAAARGLARHKWPTAIGVWESFGQGMQDDLRRFWEWLTKPHDDRDAMCIYNRNWADAYAHCERCNQ